MVGQLLVILIAAVPLFANLDALPIRIYDESRLAHNAYEMYQTGNLWVTTYDGNPDLWNTKPPFFIWMQVIFIKLIGFNELALRLPAAIAGLGICLLLLRFCRKYFQISLIGYISTIVLISSSGFVCIHGTRTGDYDSTVAFFMFASSLSFYLYTEFKAIKYIYAFAVFLSFAVLTKSIVGLMFLPGIAIYVLISRNFIKTIKDKHVYLSGILAIIIISSFYILREILSPGYLEAVQANELGGRYLETIEEHLHPFSYYYDNITKSDFNHWYILFIIGTLIGLLNNNLRIKRVSQLSIAIIISYFLFISTAQTKIEWYAIPIYPFMALMSAIGIYSIMHFLAGIRITTSKLGFELVPFIFLIAVSYEPCRKILKSTLHPTEMKGAEEFYRISHFLKDGLNGRLDLNGYLLTHENYHPQTSIYVYMLKNKGVNFDEIDYHNLSQGDHVIVHQELVKKYINDTFIFEEELVDNNVSLYHIKELKYAD